MSDRTYVVTTDIPVGGVLAYTRGQTITAQAVADNGWEDSVAAVGTKAAAEVQAEITGRPASDFQTSSSRAAAGTKTTEG